MHPAAFAQALIAEARRLYVDEPFGHDLDQTVYVLDSTTIDLCISLSPWARFRSTKISVKMHTLLDLAGNIPACLWITDAKKSDVSTLDVLIPEPGASTSWAAATSTSHGFAASPRPGPPSWIRVKKSLKFRRLYSHPVDRTTALICDQTIVLTPPDSAEAYAGKLRRMRSKDPESGKDVTLLTVIEGNLPSTISRCRPSQWPSSTARAGSGTIAQPPLGNTSD